MASSLLEVDELLEYSHVEVMRSQPPEKRDMVLEDILLFMCTSWEIHAFYKSVRGGDVGAVKDIVQIWGPQFVGAHQMNYVDALMNIHICKFSCRSTHLSLAECGRYGGWRRVG